VVVPASTSNTALTNAVNSVPANLGGNHYVICMRGGNHGNYISIKPRTNTGDSASARLILKSYPGEQASLRGEVQPSTSYNFFTLRDSRLMVASSGAPMVLSPTPIAAGTRPIRATRTCGLRCVSLVTLWR